MERENTFIILGILIAVMGLIAVIYIHEGGKKGGEGNVMIKKENIEYSLIKPNTRMGNGEIEIHEYIRYGCPYSRRFIEGTEKKLLENGNFTIYVKYLPKTEEDRKKAMKGICLGKKDTEEFKEFHQSFGEVGKCKYGKEEEELLENEISEGAKFGAYGTPTIIIVLSKNSKLKFKDGIGGRLSDGRRYVILHGLESYEGILSVFKGMDELNKTINSS